MSQIHSLFVQDAQGQYIVADDDTVVASALRIAESRIPRVENVFHTPDAVKNFLCLKLGGLPHEIFGVMFVNSQNGMIAFDEMFRGTVSQTSVYPREVVKRALQLNAAAVVLVHNHPSGSINDLCNGHKGLVSDLMFEICMRFRTEGIHLASQEPLPAANASAQAWPLAQAH